MTRFWYPLAVPTIGFEEVDAVRDVLQGGNTTMGERVEEFEEQFARYVGADHAVMVNSGSSADLLMAFASEAPKGGEVLIPAVTWPTHVWAFTTAGYDVRFVDVDGVNTTAEILLEHIDERTAAVSVPHLMGIPVDTVPLDGIWVTEDCCEALGAKVDGRPVGQLADMASWSFFFSHHMTTMEGGMVTTSDLGHAGRLRSMRSHGWHRHDGGPPYEFIGPGFNLRPTEVNAAIGLVQLARLDGFNKLRAENHRIFSETIAGCPGIELPVAAENTEPSWFGLPLFVNHNRDGLAMFLQENGVETRPILGGNLARQPAFAHWPHTGRFPGADRVHDHGLFIGLHPVADCGVEQVAQLIGEWVT